MPEPDILAVADRFKRLLIRQEEKAVREIRSYYREAERRIYERLDKLIYEMEQWRREHPDEEMPAWWLFERERLQALQRQIEDELARFAERAAERIEDAQRQMVRRAEADAEALARAGLGEPPQGGVAVTWTRLPKGALEQLVGHLQDGSPLRDLLDKLGPSASESIRRELVSGLALGLNPRDVARRCRDALNGNRVRAELIARTEMLRAYREATRQSYIANSDVVKGWIWHSARDRRTCVMCWAMHGTMFNLDERLDDHPRGRCAMVPVTKTWDELGFEGVPETELKIESGADAFDKLPVEQQEMVLGKAGLQAYRELRVDLQDFVGRSTDPRWGTMRYALSLKRALAESGMPTVVFEEGGDRLVDDVRYAIREVRRLLGSMRGIDMTVSGRSVEDEDAFGILDDQGRITLYNNLTIWRYDSDHWRDWSVRVNRPTRVAGSARERLVETLLHEMGHRLTIQRIGWYPTQGWDAAPPALVEQIRRALASCGIADVWYNIGEVVAEDFRWALLGREARPNSMTWLYDVSREDEAWNRALGVIRWLIGR